MATEERAPFKDENYDMASTLFHTMEGAWTYHRYAEDAKKAGDDECAAFFRDAAEQHEKLAERAKELIKGRL